MTFTDIEEYNLRSIAILGGYIYSQFTVIGCVTCATVIWQWLLQSTTVHMTFNDTEEYSLRSIAILGCNIYSQIAVAHVTLPKAVLSTVKIFAVCFWFCEKLAFALLLLSHSRKESTNYPKKNSEMIFLYWPGWEIYFLIFGAPNLFEFSAELFRRRACGF